jgi:hypothetical protein
MRPSMSSGVVGSLLLAAGVGSWGVVVGAAAGVRSAASSLTSTGSAAGDYPGDGELLVAAVDLRLASLVLILGGIAVLVALGAPGARWRPSGTQVCVPLCVSGFTLVPIAGLLGRAGDRGAVETVFASGALLSLSIALMLCARLWLSRQEHSEQGTEAGYRVVASVAVVFAAVAPVLELLVPGQDWVRAALPAQYVFVMPLIQAFLLAGSVLLLTTAQGRFTAGSRLAAIIVGVVGGLLLMTSPQDRAVLLLEGGIIVAAVSSLALGGPRGTRLATPTPRLRTAVAGGSLIGYFAFFYPAVFIGLPAGLFALNIGGAQTGADGIPVVMAGASLGLMIATIYLSATPYVALTARDEPAKARTTTRHLLRAR